MTLPVFSLIFMRRPPPAPGPLVMQAFIPIGCICSVVPMLPRSSTCPAAFHILAILLNFYSWITLKSSSAMKAGKGVFHSGNLSKYERLPFYSESEIRWYRFLPVGGISLEPR